MFSNLVIQLVKNIWIYNRPIQARVTGVVEQSYSNLEYRVEIYRRVDDKNKIEGKSLSNGIIVNPPVTSGPYMIPLIEPVPIGTRLQLRAVLNKDSGINSEFLNLPKIALILFSSYE